MPINLVSGEITAQQMQRFDELATEMEALVADVLIGLAVEERRSYGVMGDRTRVFAGHRQALVHGHGLRWPHPTPELKCWCAR